MAYARACRRDHQYLVTPENFGNGRSVPVIAGPLKLKEKDVRGSESMLEELKFSRATGLWEGGEAQAHGGSIGSPCGGILF